MSAVSNEQLFETLLGIKQDIGEFKAANVALNTRLTEHMAADERMGADVRKIQLGLARQKGFFTAVGTVTSILGAAIAYFIDRYVTGR